MANRAHVRSPKKANCAIVSSTSNPPHEKADPKVAEYKKRMLEWPNPVEFVNNMYGSHPGDDATEYFKTVFGK